SPLCRCRGSRRGGVGSIRPGTPLPTTCPALLCGSAANPCHSRVPMTPVTTTTSPAIHRIYIIFLGATAALGGMMFGFDIAIIVGAGPFLVQHFRLTDLGLGWAYSSLLFGCVVGSVAAGHWTDHYGRQRLLVYVAILFVHHLGRDRSGTDVQPFHPRKAC